jgi:hypothetical protein
MSLHIDLLTKELEAPYEAMLQDIRHSLLYGSLKYRDFLNRILIGSEPRYLVAHESGRMLGALPSFLKRNGTYGNVLNSLPFYGSNGGVMVSPAAHDRQGVKRGLIEALHAMGVEESVVASTVVSNPLDADTEFYESCSRYTLRDERVGQITRLPTERGDAKDAKTIQDSLLALFHQKTRNGIRKAMKSDVKVSHSDSVEALETLATLHRQNMDAVRGLAKPWSVFTAIRQTFAYDQDYRVYLGERDGVVIAALLVFFYNRVAEYYTPATAPSSRVHQGMSLLIYEAMQQAVRRGCQYWNWGGTWPSQQGVYQFKSRWGTTDMPYYYYVREYDRSASLRQLERQTLLAEYPYFYVIPFKDLTPSMPQISG